MHAGIEVTGINLSGIESSTCYFAYVTHKLRYLTRNLFSVLPFIYCKGFAWLVLLENDVELWYRNHHSLEYVL